MAMDVESGRILTTGGGWDSGGNGMWILLLAFLFMFRGGGWGGDGGHHEGGGYGGDVYKRHDAEFAALNRNEWDLQKEGIVGRFESRIASLECCCQTNQNIKDVSCEVAKQGELTRAHESQLAQNATIAAMQAKISELESIKYSDRTVEKLYERFRHEGYGGNCGCGPNFRPVYAFDQPIRYAPVREEERRHCDVA